MNYILAPLLLAILYVVRHSTKKKRQSKFNSLGDLSGKNKEYVTNILGKPNNEAILVNGSHLVQWHSNGSHISIIFDSQGNFVRITNQKNLMAVN